MTAMWAAAVALAHSPLIVGLALMFTGMVWIDVAKRR